MRTISDIKASGAGWIADVEVDHLCDRVTELTRALINLLHACERYDDDPDGTLSQAAYLQAKSNAGMILGETWRAQADNL